MYYNDCGLFYFQIMYGFGTLVNVLAIVAGGIVGLTLGRFLKKRWQEGIVKAMALTCLFIAIAGFLEASVTVTDGALHVTGILMAIVSFAIGTTLGEIVDIDGKIVTFGEFLKAKTGNAKDPDFVAAFVTASLTVCIGAMAILGAIGDALRGDCSILYAKSILDFVIITIMATSLGKGVVFSAVSVGLFQGTVTLLAYFIEPFMTAQAVANLSMTGSMMIFCIGVNLIRPATFKVANMLPTLVVAVLWAYF